MIITDISKCRGIEKCETCPFKESSKCMKVCPTNAIRLMDNKAFSCITCGTCARECPNNAIKKNEFGGYYVDRRRCNGCGTCEKACPINIIVMKKEEKIVNNNKREFSYPDGICVMCGLCAEVCPYDARMYFNLKDLKSKKNRALAERYLSMFNRGTIKGNEISDIGHIESKPNSRLMEVRVSINIDREKCAECGKCVYLCPKNTILEKEEVDGCTRCNICGDVCPKDAINCGEVDTETCILCGNCIEKCPKDALQISNFKVVKIKEDKKTIPLKHCINCGLCADKCPAGALKIENNKVLYDPSSCKLCNACVNVCPQGVRINKGEVVDGGCVLCGICIDVCPKDAISIEEIKRFDVIKDENCIGCGTCSNVCPRDAITVKIIKFKNEICKSIKREVVFDENCIMCENCAIHCPRDVIPNTTGYKNIIDRDNSFIRTDFDFCVFCGLCNKICPNDAVDKGKFDWDKCEFCSACANICPTHAISIYRKWVEK
ncbi:4Fe-4S binding protein [Methanothermococcus sp. Ax23]|uniref:4Fe-4S binding protein n=1 Tax=Methanothermococcus sp. Ax23 TaxID=3156486 RepID=UPI003B9EB79D